MGTLARGGTTSQQAFVKSGLSKKEYKKKQRSEYLQKTGKVTAESVSISLPEGDWKQETDPKTGKIRFVSGNKYTAWRTYAEWEKVPAQEKTQAEIEKKQIESGEYVKSKIGKSGVRKTYPYYEEEKGYIEKGYKKKYGERVTPEWSEGFTVKPRETTTQRIKRTIVGGIEETKREPKKAVTDLPSAIGLGIQSFGVGAVSMYSPFELKGQVYSETGERLSLAKELSLEKEKLSPVGKGVSIGTEFATIGVSLIPLGSFAKPTTQTFKVSAVKGKQAKATSITDVEYSAPSWFKTSKTRRIVSKTDAIVTPKQAKAVTKSAFIDKPKKLKWGISTTDVEARIDLSGKISFVEAKVKTAQVVKSPFSFKKPATTFQPSGFKLKNIQEPSGIIIEAKPIEAFGVEIGKTSTGGISGETAGINIYLDAIKKGGTKAFGYSSSSGQISKTVSKTVNKEITASITKSTQKLIQSDITKKSLMNIGASSTIGLLSTTATKTRARASQKARAIISPAVSTKYQQKSIISTISLQQVRSPQKTKPVLITSPFISQKETQKQRISEYLGLREVELTRTITPTKPVRPTIPVTPQPIIGKPTGLLLFPPIFGGGLGVGYSFKRKKKTGKRKYKPDIYSIFTGYTAKQKPIISTGLEPRPIIRR